MNESFTTSGDFAGPPEVLRIRPGVARAERVFRL
jgi:hypothetical protein